MSAKLRKLNLLQRSLIKATLMENSISLKIEKYIEDIYFFDVNTKCISSNVMKISVNSRVRSTSEFSDIFNT